MKNESPAEPFKRAVSIAVRALAGEPELEVNFSAEPPSLKGAKARLPLPSRNLPPNEVAIVRGAGDAYALRRAYHEDKIHDQYRPQSQDAAAIFEAAEQARVEAIGALAMKGVAQNLAAGVEARVNQRGLPKLVPEPKRQLPMWWDCLCAKNSQAKHRQTMRKSRSICGAPSSRNVQRRISIDLVMSSRSKGVCKAHAHHPQRPEFQRRVCERRRRGFRRRGRRRAGEPRRRRLLRDVADIRGSEIAIRRPRRRRNHQRNALEQRQEMSDAQQEPEEGTRPWRPEQPFADQDQWGYRIHTTQFDEIIECHRSVRRRRTLATAQFS